MPFIRAKMPFKSAGKRFAYLNNAVVCCGLAVARRDIAI